LENVLKNLRGFVENKIITVFGCGGNRDKLKRPLMGEIADRLSDAVILTSDNPRDEDPFSIIRQIRSGVKGKVKLEIEENRKKAIAKAVDLAQTGDCILIAGKGHEDWQIIKEKKIKFNDAEVVKSLLGCENAEIA